MQPAKRTTGASYGPLAAPLPQLHEGNIAGSHPGHSGDLNPLLGPESSVSNALAPGPRNAARPSMASQEESWASPGESWAQQASVTLHPLELEAERRTAAAAAEPALAAAAAAVAIAAQEASIAAAAAEAGEVAVAEAAAAIAADADASEALNANGGAAWFHHVFVFTNPTSGGNKAAAFTRVSQSDTLSALSGSTASKNLRGFCWALHLPNFLKMPCDLLWTVAFQFVYISRLQTSVSQLTLTDPYRVKMFIYDIREGRSGSKPGFLLLKAIAAKVGASRGLPGARTIRILVAGGDGTVMWCLEEMTKTGVNGDCCAVGVVPYGTGETTTPHPLGPFLKSEAMPMPGCAYTA